MDNQTKTPMTKKEFALYLKSFGIEKMRINYLANLLDPSSKDRANYGLIAAAAIPKTIDEVNIWLIENRK